jgi:hypothetical protein
MFNVDQEIHELAGSHWLGRYQLRAAFVESMGKLTGHVPPEMIFSKDKASGMPYGQLEEELTEPTWLFSVSTETLEDATYAGRR